jgi:hypothetical protein
MTTFYTAIAYSHSVSQRQRQRYIATDSQSVSLGVEPNLGLLTRDIFFFL